MWYPWLSGGFVLGFISCALLRRAFNRATGGF